MQSHQENVCIYGNLAYLNIIWVFLQSLTNPTDLWTCVNQTLYFDFIDFDIGMKSFILLYIPKSIIV